MLTSRTVKSASRPRLRAANGRMNESAQRATTVQMTGPHGASDASSTRQTSLRLKKENKVDQHSLDRKWSSFNPSSQLTRSEHRDEHQATVFSDPS